jgi:hypothetical protein
MFSSFGVAFVFLMGVVCLILIVAGGETSRELAFQREIQLIRTKADIDQRPHILSICNTYMTLAKEQQWARDQMPEFSRVCAQFLTLEVSND